jgi:hypothetical protein
MKFIARCRVKLQTKKCCWDYFGDYSGGIGIAMVPLIESTVSVMTRQSDSAPIASEAAIALVNWEEATGVRRLTKPAVPVDRAMV